MAGAGGSHLVRGCDPKVALFFGFDSFATLKEVHAAVADARGGSSGSRAHLYSAVWQGFLEAPWIDHGWFGSDHAGWFRVEIGSHSTFYGVLYEGGVIMFGLICIAYVVTLLANLSSMTRSKSAVDAFAVLLAFAMTSYGENLDTLIPPLALVFLWIGGELRPGASRWQSNSAATPRSTVSEASPYYSRSSAITASYGSLE